MNETDGCEVFVSVVGVGPAPCPNVATDYKEATSILSGDTTIIMVCPDHGKRD